MEKFSHFFDKVKETAVAAKEVAADKLDTAKTYGIIGYGLASAGVQTAGKKVVETGKSVVGRVKAQEVRVPRIPFSSLVSNKTKPTLSEDEAIEAAYQEALKVIETDKNEPVVVKEKEEVMSKTEEPKAEESIKTDDTRFVGLTEEGANALAMKDGLRVRVMRRSGEDLIGTGDVDNDRINVEVDRGVIIRVMNRG